ncbi:hypothetical protein Gohar_010010 [Gossypium harknessii]|uniref:Clp R domain-containing protein n=1 Tax=Gossypium harknessii TaxID=34285 RepID=A0A7J9GPI9_9ROSI|nr:hypothetical protein [Gossypium harknessii]
MAASSSTTSMASVNGFSLCATRSVSNINNLLLTHPRLSFSFPSKPNSLKSFKPLQLRKNGVFERFSRTSSRPFVVRCEASTGKVLSPYSEESHMDSWSASSTPKKCLTFGLGGVRNPPRLKITQQDFTEMAWQAIVSSPDVAKENKHQIVETEHLMKALLEQKNGLARRIFLKVGVDNTRLLEATDKFIQRQPKVLGESAGSMLGRDLEALMQRAREYKKEYGDSFVSVEHLVLGFTQDRRFGKQLFKDFQISNQALKSAIESIRGRQSVTDQDPEGKYEALEKYGKDLTAMAREGKLDPVIGRDDEIRRCIQILSRRTKNNPVLIGEPGVGKTAISEGYVYVFGVFRDHIPKSVSSYASDTDACPKNRSRGCPSGFDEP